jgi:hypothetical protein
MVTQHLLTVVVYVFDSPIFLSFRGHHQDQILLSHFVINVVKIEYYHFFLVSFLVHVLQYGFSELLLSEIADQEKLVKELDELGIEMNASNALDFINEIYIGLC